MKKKQHSVTCASCGKEQLTKNEIGINKKLLGETISCFYCLTCLADYLGVYEQDILDKIEEFREEGCKLFE